MDVSTCDGITDPEKLVHPVRIAFDGLRLPAQQGRLIHFPQISWVFFKIKIELVRRQCSIVGDDLIKGGKNGLDEMGIPGQDVAAYNKSESSYTIEFYSNKDKKMDTFQSLIQRLLVGA